MWSPVAGLFPAVSMGTVSHRPNVGAALRRLSQRGLQRGSCGELRLPVYASFTTFCSRAGVLRPHHFSSRKSVPAWLGRFREKVSSSRRPAFRPLALEVELQCELDDAGIPGALHAAKIRAVRDVAVRLEELRVVEDIVKLGSKLDPIPFADRRVF